LTCLWEYETYITDMRTQGVMVPNITRCLNVYDKYEESGMRIFDFISKNKLNLF